MFQPEEAIIRQPLTDRNHCMHGQYYSCFTAGKLLYDYRNQKLLNCSEYLCTDSPLDMSKLLYDYRNHKLLNCSEYLCTDSPLDMSVNFILRDNYLNLQAAHFNLFPRIKAQTNYSKEVTKRMTQPELSWLISYTK
jgi:hypothetical protein